MGKKQRWEHARERIRSEMLLGFLKNSHPRIDGKHVSCDTLPNNFSKCDRDFAKKAQEELIKEGFILRRVSKKGYQKCSLNGEKLEEILKMHLIVKNVENDEFLKKKLESRYHLKIK